MLFSALSCIRACIQDVSVSLSFFSSFVYLLYVVFTRCSFDKYFIQYMLNNYIKNLYFYKLYAEFMHQSCMRSFSDNIHFKIMFKTIL